MGREEGRSRGKRRGQTTRSTTKEVNGRTRRRKEGRRRRGGGEDKWRCPKENLAERPLWSLQRMQEGRLWKLPKLSRQAKVWWEGGAEAGLPAESLPINGSKREEGEIWENSTATREEGGRGGQRRRDAGSRRDRRGQRHSPAPEQRCKS